MTDERPAAPSLTPRIRPARDEGVDPVDTVRPASVIPPMQPAPTFPVTQAPAVPLQAPVETPATATASPVQSWQAADPAPRQAVSARRMRAEPTVQLTSRVSEEVRDMLDDIVVREGGTVRRALERAIAAYAARQP